MNSLLQGLSACPTLIQWLEGFAGQDSAGQSKKAGQQSLSLTLLRLLKGRSPFARSRVGVVEVPVILTFDSLFCSLDNLANGHSAFYDTKEETAM